MIGQETWCSFSYCQVAMVFYGHAFEIVNFAVLNQKLPRIKFYIPFITLAFSIGLEYFWTLVGDLPTFVKSWDSRWRIQESCCLELMALLHVIWDGHSMLWSLKEIFFIVISFAKLPFSKSYRGMASKSSPSPSVKSKQKASKNKINVDMFTGTPHGIDRRNKLGQVNCLPY